MQLPPSWLLRLALGATLLCPTFEFHFSAAVGESALQLIAKIRLSRG